MIIVQPVRDRNELVVAIEVLLVVQMCPQRKHLIVSDSTALVATVAEIHARAGLTCPGLARPESSRAGRLGVILSPSDAVEPAAWRTGGIQEVLADDLEVVDAGVVLEDVRVVRSPQRHAQSPGGETARSVQAFAVSLGLHNLTLARARGGQGMNSMSSS